MYSADSAYHALVVGQEHGRAFAPRFMGAIVRQLVSILSRGIAPYVNGYEAPSGLPLPNSCKHALGQKSLDPSKYHRDISPVNRDYGSVLSPGVSARFAARTTI
jgi:hypothetical protein